MKNHQEQELERLVERELKRLPDVPAPQTLVHRVMLAVQQRQQRPWWQRPWLTWPPGSQVASFFVLAASVGMVSHLAGLVHGGIDTISISHWPSEWAALFAPVGTTLKTLGLVLSIVLREIGQPVLLALGAAWVLCYLACIAVGTACFRLAFNRS